MTSLDAVEQELKRRHPHGLSIAVAVDGSVASGFTELKRGDKLSIYHVSDKSKSYLPNHLKPAHLKNYYQDMVASLKLGLTADWVCREKEEGQSTCQAVTKMANKSAVDVLVLGSFGRKGEKLDILGSVSDYSLRESHASLCIVRSTGSKRFDKTAKFLFATDGSHAASLAFCALITKIRRATDRVHVVMISTTDGVLEEKVVEQYKTFMDKHHVLGNEVRVKCIDRSKVTVPEGILEAAKEDDADVLVLGISGYSKKKLGSVSEEISVRAHCTTLVIKDSFEVLTPYSTMGAVSLAKELLPSAPRAYTVA